MRRKKVKHFTFNVERSTERMKNRRQEGGLAGGKGAGDKDPLALAHSPAVAFGGFLVISSSFHIANEPLFFAEFFESPHHLLNRFARS